MKMDKKDLMRRISDLIEDEDTKISVLEDLEDSIVENTTDIINEEEKKELENLRWKYEDLREKYKERFLTSDKKAEETEDIEEKEDEKVIDIKEI